MSAASDLLNLWEAGVTAVRFDRDQALLTQFGVTAPVALSERNAALLQMRSQLFGKTQQLRCNCPDCGTTIEFAVDCQKLSQSMASRDSQNPDPLSCNGYLIHFRMPDSVDVGAAAQMTGKPFEDALLSRCVTRSERAGRPISIEKLPRNVLEQLSARMEELEPGASISFKVTCPECAASWAAPMGAGEVLWAELQARAERLILDVDLLARTYGWSEAGILEMRPARRAAYLQLAGALQ